MSPKCSIHSHSDTTWAETGPPALHACGPGPFAPAQTTRTLPPANHLPPHAAHHVNVEPTALHADAPGA